MAAGINKLGLCGFVMAILRQVLGKLLLALGLLGAMGPLRADEPGARVWRDQKLFPWLVYYSDQASFDQLSPFNLLILDSTYYPPLEPLISRGKIVLGYLSLVEVEKHRAHFSQAKDAGVLLQENAYWPGSFMVDVRERFWTELVLTKLIPEILHQGFQGIFIDTLDNAAFLEHQVDPGGYKGMVRSAAQLLRAIRRHYPDIPIMVNRGFDVFIESGGAADFMLAESFRSDYDFESKTYSATSDYDFRAISNYLATIRKDYPETAIFTLDYWDMADTGGVTKLYVEQEKAGFLPYVSTVELDQVYSDPR